MLPRAAATLLAKQEPEADRFAPPMITEYRRRQAESAFIGLAKLAPTSRGRANSCSAQAGQPLRHSLRHSCATGDRGEP